MNRSMTSDALAALTSTGLSRRAFVKGSGALIVAFSAARLAGDLGIAPAGAAAQGINGPGSTALDSWIAINADGSVTAYTGKCELGTGLFTAQTQLVAEELSVPIDRVRLMQCDTSITPDQGTTSGAQSHPANFNQSNLALAGATARETLVQLGAARLGVPAGQLTTADGAVMVRDDAARRVSYGELIGGRQFSVPLNRNAKRKPASEWTVMGQPIPRLDIPAMATGQFEYVHNVRVPDMLHGRVIRPPTFSSTVGSVDEQSVQGMPGVVRVVVRQNFIGVVAEKPWQAVQAARQLKVVWSEGARLPDQGTFHEQLRSQAGTRDTLLVDSGDVDAQLTRATRVVRATYLYPYQMHASIATACSVADVRNDGATVWSSTQNVYGLRSTMSMLLGLEPDSIRITFRLGPGCYGVNGADTVSYDAALMSQAVGRPVRVQLARQDEMAWENYGLAYVLDERAGLDANGTIACWDHEAWSVSRGGRPGGQRPGNVVTGSLAGFEAALPAPRAAVPPTREYDNGGNFVPSYVTGCSGGVCGGTGTIRSERVLSHVAESPFFTGPLRSPNRLQNTFAHECFMDEVAASVNADPVEYRLRHLSDPRLRDVVTAAAAKADWDARPSPRADIGQGVVTGRGVSCVLYEGDNGYCSVVAQVEVNQDTGLVVVRRCVAAIDCGPISNPDGLRNQVEGGIIHGMSRALREEVTWNAERVTSVDWQTYRPWYLGDEVPIIESVLIDRPDEAATGAGETSITVTAAAIGNAIFDATGARVRQVPFTPERVKAALGARRAG
jgi:nicotinate dehydrogenase subunit B